MILRNVVVELFSQRTFSIGSMRVCVHQLQSRLKDMRFYCSVKVKHLENQCI